MSLEFFNQPSNLTRDRIMYVDNGHYHHFRDLDPQNLRIIYLRLLESDEACEKLRILKRFGIDKPEAQIRQFAQCNWGRLDHVEDLDENGELNFEFVPCKYRNHGCKFNSEICIRKY